MWSSNKMKIIVNYSETINTGNYQSKKIDLGLEFDIIYTSQEDLDNVYKKHFEYLKSKVLEFKNL